MAFPVNATLAAGLLFAQERLVSLREKLHGVNHYDSLPSKCR